MTQPRGSGFRLTPIPRYYDDHAAGDARVLRRMLPALAAGVPGHCPRSGRARAVGARPASSHRAAVTSHRAPADGSPSTALVVLVPGLGLDARAWSAVRASLRGPSVVVHAALDGSSRGRETDLHVEQQSRRLIAALPPGRDVVLVGHSASCPVVVDVATRTSRVVGLVLVGPVTDPQARSWPRMLGSVAAHGGTGAPVGGTTPRAAVPVDRADVDAARHEPDAPLPHARGPLQAVGTHAHHPRTA